MSTIIIDKILPYKNSTNTTDIPHRTRANSTDVQQTSNPHGLENIRSHVPITASYRTRANSTDNTIYESSEPLQEHCNTSIRDKKRRRVISDSDDEYQPSDEDQNNNKRNTDKLPIKVSNVVDNQSTKQHNSSVNMTGNMTGIDLNKHIKFKKNVDDFNQKYGQAQSELDRLNRLIESDLNLDLKIAGLKAPDYIRAHALKILRSYRDDSENGASYRLVVDKILSVPWSTYRELPIQIGAPFQRIQDFLNTAKLNMDTHIYGHQQVKNEIIEYLAELLINPTANRILGISGPPGIGKTSLIKCGLGETLNRPLCTILLGGAKDASFLTGYSPVYKGSHAGELLNSLIKAQCLNPILYFDEVDKVSDLDIQHLLIHLTDTLQNKELVDNFTEIKMDLSRAIIIFSYNDPDNIHPTLLNRIKQINLSGYTNEDKFLIMRDYKIPEMLKLLNLSGRLDFTDRDIKYLNSKVAPEPGIRKILQLYESLIAKVIHSSLDNENSYKRLLGKGKLPMNIKNFI